MSDNRRARETIEDMTAAGTESVRSVQEGFASAIENVRDANFSLMDMTRANLDATFDFVHDVATATRPSDLLEAWSSHTSKQAEMLTKQTKELTALSQQFASTIAEPVKRTTKGFRRG